MKTTSLRAALMVSATLLAAAPMALPAYASPTEAIVAGSFADIAEQSIPAVVTVQVEMNRPAAGPDDFMKRFFGQLPPGMQPPPSEQAPGSGHRVGLGSGFIVDADGLIVTNNHVVAEGTRITVTLSSGEELDATLIGTDPSTDLAVLRVDAGRPLPTIAWGDSDDIRIGDWAVAIGNPFGLGGTVTAGIVSARGRDIHSGPYDDFLQVDTAINQGNSGGPLLDTGGHVIGVNTAIFSPNGANVGVGFAIPSNQAREIVTALAENGSVERGWLGVAIQPVTDDIAEALGIGDARGALVAEVVAGSPADAAGLKAGDVVLSLDGTGVTEPRDLSASVASVKPGTDVALQVWRDGKEWSISVEIGRLEAERQAAATPVLPETGGEAVAGLGIGIVPATNGVEVTAVDPAGPAAESGLRPGDVILTADSIPVTSPGTLADGVAAARKSGRHAVLLQTKRNGSTLFVAVPIDGA